MELLILALILSLTLNFVLFKKLEHYLSQSTTRETPEEKRKRKILAAISDYHHKSQEQAKQSLLEALSLLRKEVPDKQPEDIIGGFGYYGYMYELTLVWQELNRKNYVNACDELEKVVLFYPIFQPRVLSAIILLLERFLEATADVLDKKN